MEEFEQALFLLLAFVIVFRTGQQFKVNASPLHTVQA